MLLFHAFGNYLFAACDMLVGLLRQILIDTILSKSTVPSDDNKPTSKNTPERDTIDQRATPYTAIHLLDPLVFSILTRGSSESIIGALVVALCPHEPLRSRSYHVGRRCTLEDLSHRIWRVVDRGSGNPGGSKGRTTNLRRWVGSLVNRKTVRLAVVTRKLGGSGFYSEPP
jgi:phosphatidylinositol glycan class M